MDTLGIEMESIVATLLLHSSRDNGFSRIDLVGFTMSPETQTFSIDINAGHDDFTRVFNILRNKTRLGLMSQDLLNLMHYPEGVDIEKFKWFWSIALNSYTIWLSLCEYFEITTGNFDSWVRTDITMYNDNDSIDLIQQRLADELFNSFLRKLRTELVEITSVSNGNTRGRLSAGLLSRDSNEPPQKKKIDTNKKKSSSPNKVKVSHMPDVWGYSDTYFELQNSIQNRVLEYLVFMGYDDAVKTFLNESLNINHNHVSISGEKSLESKPNKRLNLDDVFTNWGIETPNTFKIDMIHDIDMDEITTRKSIKKLILSGLVEEALNLIEMKFPSVLNRFPSVKFRLRHLEIVEKIKTYLETPNEDVDEDKFIENTMKFIGTSLTKREILQDKELTSQMEETMLLIAVCRKGEEVPEPFKHIVSNSMRREVAKVTNDAIWSYNSGESNNAIVDVTKLMAWSFGPKMSMKQTANSMLRERPGSNL